MKTLISFFAFLFVVFSLSAQTDSTKVSNPNRFGLQTAKLTGETVQVEGKTYEVWSTEKTGAKFLKVVSPRTNNEYPVWIGAATDEKIEGYTVRTTKSGKKFLLKIDFASKNPICVYLTGEKTETAAK